MDYLKDQQVRIFDIQRYSIHDGPGIRTIVFLKGLCPALQMVLQSGIPGVQAIQTMMVLGRRQDHRQRCDCGRNASLRWRRIVPYYRRSGGGLTLSGGESLLPAGICQRSVPGCKGTGHQHRA